MWEIFILLVIFIVGLVWTGISVRKQAVSDWKTLEYLKTKANEVTTKEEIEAFHEEFREKASKIHNQYITPELNRIDGYLRGLYVKYKDVKSM